LLEKESNNILFISTAISLFDVKIALSHNQSINIFLRFLMADYNLSVSYFKVFTTVPNSVRKVFSFIFIFFFVDIFKSSSENCSAVLSSFKYTHIFLVKEKFSI
jgi:hypothetical protein